MIPEVALWFAKNSKGEIKTIDEVKYHDDKYYCPLCNSEVIPKALRENSKVAEHFAHLDRSKCTPESMIHWWYKNKFIQIGDKFIVTTDKLHTYVCKNILIEQVYHTEHGDYKPDVTIITESGDIVYFEYAFTNKKRVKDYLDKWLELGNIVVEVNLKTLLQSHYGKDTYNFHALFYDGKCFNTNKRDLYYKTIGQYKEQVYSDKTVDNKKKKEIEKLDYIWSLIAKYKAMKLSKNELLSELYNYDCIFNKVVIDIFVKSRCTEIIDDLFNGFKQQILDDIKLYNDIDYPNMYDHLRIYYRYKTRYNDPMIEIEHYNIEEKCWYVSNSSYYNNKQELIDCILKDFKQNSDELELEKQKDENDRKFLTVKNVILNSDFIKYLTCLFNSNSIYDIDINFNSNKNDNKFENNIVIGLKFNYSNCYIINHSIKINVDSCDYKSLYSAIKENIQNALLNMNPFSCEQISQFDNIVNQLNKQYSNTKLNVNFNGELIRPNEYEINYIYNFKKEGRSKRNRPYLYSSNEHGTLYINNNCIKMLCEKPYNYSNIFEVKSIIASIVSQVIRNLKKENKIIDRR